MRMLKRRNAERDEAMRILADAGSSVAHIASRFGLTRNAVIGALWRARRRHAAPAYIPTLNKPPVIPAYHKPGPISRGFR